MIREEPIGFSSHLSPDCRDLLKRLLDRVRGRGEGVSERWRETKGLWRGKGRSRFLLTGFVGLPAPDQDERDPKASLDRTRHFRVRTVGHGVRSSSLPRRAGGTALGACPAPVPESVKFESPPRWPYRWPCSSIALLTSEDLLLLGTIVKQRPGYVSVPSLLSSSLSSILPPSSLTPCPRCSLPHP